MTNDGRGRFGPHRALVGAEVSQLDFMLSSLAALQHGEKDGPSVVVVFFYFLGRRRVFGEVLLSKDSKMGLRA